MTTTLRLTFPQWQGGDNPPYHLGAMLLSWLAPPHDGPSEVVPVSPPAGAELPLQNGILDRKTLLRQAHDARELIDRHDPDRIVVLGGDCLVDLAPLAYLSERYGDDLAVLWIDTHPDIMTPAQFTNAHAMVLGNLLGRGDAEFKAHVARPLKPQNVMFLGLHGPSDWERSEMKRLELQVVSPTRLTEEGSSPILEWFHQTGARHLAIHFDLDVLDPSTFRSLLFAKPDVPENAFAGVAQGKLTISQVLDVIGDVAQQADVVGLGITEHLPWDALALKNMLGKLPLLGKAST